MGSTGLRAPEHAATQISAGLGVSASPKVCGCTLAESRAGVVAMGIGKPQETVMLARCYQERPVYRSLWVALVELGIWRLMFQRGTSLSVGWIL